MEAIFSMFFGSREGDIYHIRRVEDRPVSALFLGFAWHIAVRAPALVSVHGVYSGAYARLYSLVHGMVVRLEW